jgi:hypothetical protein
VRRQISALGGERRPAVVIAALSPSTNIGEWRGAFDRIQFATLAPSPRRTLIGLSMDALPLIEGGVAWLLTNPIGGWPQRFVLAGCDLYVIHSDHHPDDIMRLMRQYRPTIL